MDRKARAKGRASSAGSGKIQNERDDEQLSLLDIKNMLLTLQNTVTEKLNAIDNQLPVLRANVEAINQRQDSHELEVRQEFGKLRETIQNNEIRMQAHILAQSVNVQNRNERLNNSEIEGRQENRSNSHYVLPNFKIKDLIRPFDGKPTSDPILFLKSLKKFINTQNMSIEYIFNAVRSILIEDALLWFDLLENTVSSFEEFEQEFLNRFWGNSKQSCVLSKLFTGRYNNRNENSRVAYCARIFHELQYISPKLSEEDIIIHLAKHFGNQIYMQFLLNQRNTYNELIRTLKLYDEIYDNNHTVQQESNFGNRAPRNNDRYAENLRNNNQNVRNDAIRNNNDRTRRNFQSNFDRRVTENGRNSDRQFHENRNFVNRQRHNPTNTGNEVNLVNLKGTAEKGATSDGEIRNAGAIIRNNDSSSVLSTTEGARPKPKLVSFENESNFL